MHPFDLAPVGIHAGAGIDAGGIDAAVAQQRSQMVQIVLHPVKGPGEQMVQVMGIYLPPVHPGLVGQPLHHMPDVAPVQRLMLDGFNPDSEFITASKSSGLHFIFSAISITLL